MKSDSTLDFIQMQNMKLMSRRHILFRSFWINTLFVVLVWLLMFIPGVVFLGVVLTGVPAPVFYAHAMATLALWGLAGVILFLIPALAITRQ